MIGINIENVRDYAPLIHCITSYVTAKDVANAILACGGNPIITDEIKEIEDIVKMSDAVNINIGTINDNSLEAMLLAGKKANEEGKVVVLDTVSAGASKYRTEAVLKLMQEIDFTVIKGNILEIKNLAHSNLTGAYESNLDDYVKEDNLDEAIKLVTEFAARTRTIVVATGEIDLVCNSEKCYVIRNGIPQMSKVRGVGCQLTGLITAFIVANKKDILEATVAAVCSMGLAGEIAYGKMKMDDGNASLNTRIIDAIYNMNEVVLDKGANYELVQQLN